MTIPELTDLYDKEDAEISKLEDALKQKKAEHLKTEAQLYELMSASGYESLVHGGSSYSLKDTTHYSVVPEMAHILMDALKEYGFGGIVKETVNPRTLSAFVREQVEDNGGQLPSWLQGAVREYTDHKISRRRAV